MVRRSPSDLLLGVVAREECFNNSGTTDELCHSGPISLTAIALANDSLGFFFPIPIVWEDAFLFDLLGGGFEPAVPSLIRNLVSSHTTSHDTVSITNF